MIPHTESTDSPSDSPINPIRALHIFPPSYKVRFGGPIIRWRYYFNRWDEIKISHLVLDTQTNQITECKEAFNFQFTEKQNLTQKWERFTWIFSLFKNLIKHQKDYDILHVHVLWWGSLLIGPWASRKKIPVIYESVLLNEDSPGGIINERLGKLKLWCLKKFSAILTISDSLTEDYLNFDFHASQVHTLMNAVDSEFFHPARSESERKALRKKYLLPEESKILLFVGSVIQRKGVDVLIDAFIRAVREEKDLYLILVGASNKEENPSLDEQFIHLLHDVLDKKGLASKVKFIGLIQDRDQLAEIYRAADIFIFPSRNEGLPNVVLEAMACGLPVVVSRLPVLEQVITNGKNGLFVPVDNADALKGAILSMARQPEYSQQLGKNARNYIETHHSFNQWQTRLVSLYQSLMF